MIKLSSQVYNMKGLTKSFFWEELNKISVGQYVNPEFAYTTRYHAKKHHIFGGRKEQDKFSIFQHRPIYKSLLLGILTKGKISESKTGLKIECKFEIPLWSLIAFLFLSYLFFIRFSLISETAGILATAIWLGVYILVLDLNHRSIKKVVEKTFREFKRIDG